MYTGVRYGHYACHTTHCHECHDLLLKCAQLAAFLALEILLHSLAALSVHENQNAAAMPSTSNLISIVPASTLRYYCRDFRLRACSPRSPVVSDLHSGCYEFLRSKVAATTITTATTSSSSGPKIAVHFASARSNQRLPCNKLHYAHSRTYMPIPVFRTAHT